MTWFRFKDFSTLYVTFPKNGLQFIAQKFPENSKMLFSKAQNIRVLAEGTFKIIL